MLWPMKLAIENVQSYPSRWRWELFCSVFASCWAGWWWPTPPWLCEFLRRVMRQLTTCRAVMCRQRWRPRLARHRTANGWELRCTERVRPEACRSASPQGAILPQSLALWRSRINLRSLRAKCRPRFVGDERVMAQLGEFYSS